MASPLVAVFSVSSPVLALHQLEVALSVHPLHGPDCDPITGPLRPLLRRLQFPVMKTALADPDFFGNAQHPVRSLVHEIFDMLSSADAASDEEIRRLAEQQNKV